MARSFITHVCKRHIRHIPVELRRAVGEEIDEE